MGHNFVSDGGVTLKGGFEGGGEGESYLSLDCGDVKILRLFINKPVEDESDETEE